MVFFVVDASTGDLAHARPPITVSRQLLRQALDSDLEQLRAKGR
jgi:hypothetical protein